MRFRLFTVLSLTAIAVAVPAMGTNLYNQPTDFGLSYASQNDPSSGNLATTFDDFTLAQASTINQVTWDGGYFNGTQAPILAFTVDFWANNVNQPGAMLATFHVLGTNNETFLQNDKQGNATFSYSMNVNFGALAGTEYWLSIVPDLSFPPQWGWETGTGGDGKGWQCFTGCGSIPNDLAFGLNGTVNSGVPEPLSLGLMGAGLAALGLVK